MFGSKNYVCLNNERIITDKYYFDRNWYDIQTGNMLDESNVTEKTKKELIKYENEMKKILDLSMSVTLNNLLQRK